MDAKTNKNVVTAGAPGQNRLLQETLKKFLGAGLLKTPQRCQHEIHPHVLRDILSFRMLNK